MKNCLNQDSQDYRMNRIKAKAKPLDRGSKTYRDDEQQRQAKAKPLDRGSKTYRDDEQQRQAKAKLLDRGSKTYRDDEQQRQAKAKPLDRGSKTYRDDGRGMPRPYGCSHFTAPLFHLRSSASSADHTSQ